ncbi:MAG TPA: outer membrane beta-barrel protein [Thermoanaerobaculia bacterium]|nr:outer membrane beta-barrel protein [Thermoanaerobaculia bacterium]
MRKLAFLSLLLLASTSLFAQPWRGSDRGRRDRYGYRDNYFELTPLAGYRYGGTIYSSDTGLFNRDVDIAGDATYGLNLGIPINDSGLKLELLVDRQRSHLTTGGSDLFGSDLRLARIDTTYYQAGILVPFSRSRNLTPYFALDAGIATLDIDVPGTSAANRFAASAAIGLKFPVADNIGIKIEERGFFANTGSYNNDRCGFFDCNSRNDTNLYQGETTVGVSFKF